MPKMTGAECLAEMLGGYGVTHVFMVPAVLRRTFAEMEGRTSSKRIHVHGEKSAAYMADGCHTPAPPASPALQGAGDRGAQRRRRLARCVPGALPGHCHDRRPRPQDQVPQGLPGGRRRAGVRAGRQIQRNDRRRFPHPRHGAPSLPRCHLRDAGAGASAVPRQRGSARPGVRRNLEPLIEALYAQVPPFRPEPELGERARCARGAAGRQRATENVAPTT